MSLSPAFLVLKTTGNRKDPFHLFATFSVQGLWGSCPENNTPHNLLVLCEPYEVRCGMRDSHEAGHLKSCGDSTEIPHFRFEIKSKLKELQAVCNDRTARRRGEGQEGNYTRNVGQARGSPSFQCSCSLCAQIRVGEWCPGKQKGTRVLKRPLAMGNASAAMP